jgi:hypothetical protein
MEWIDIAVERTTAATDLLLAVVAVAAAVWILHTPGDPFRRRLWAGMFGLLALSATLGAVVHGLKISPETQALLWQPLFLSLGWAVGLFLVAVALDLFGARVARRVLPLVLLLGLGFYAVTAIFEGSFFYFVLYQAAALGLALVVYSGLVLKGFPGARPLVLGIALILAASMVQAGGTIEVHWIWPFDHNGVYHLMLVPATVLLTTGVRASQQRKS